MASKYAITKFGNTRAGQTILIKNKYQLREDKKLGSGGFGEVYEGINLATRSAIAIKIETKQKKNLLGIEAKILSYLQGEGVPKVYDYLQDEECCCIVMDQLGDNMETLLNKNNRKFSLKTVTMLGIQLLNRIEYIHKLHIIHRDIKPENICIGGKGKKNMIYLVDFGLSKRFRNPRTGEHIKYRDGLSLTGTARYCSVYTHLGIEQSRRDDLESLLLTLIYLYNGSLPWCDIISNSKSEKHIKIMEKKINMSSERLCQGMPKEFLELYEYSMNLQFEEKPDYEFMREKLRDVLRREGLSCDWIFDWNKKKPKKSNFSASTSGTNSFNNVEKEV